MTPPGHAPKKPGPLRRVTEGGHGRLTLAVGLQALAALVGIVPFIAVGELARRLLDDPAPSGARVWPLVSTAAGAALLALVLAYAAATLSHYADNALQLRLRRELAEHVGRLPLGWFTSRGTGRITAATHDDVHALHHLVAHTLLDVTTVLVAPTAALAYLLTVDWRLALVAVLPAVAGMLLFRRAMAGAGEQMVEYHRAQTRITSAAVEFADGIPVVKAFGRERTPHGRFTRAADDFAAFFAAWSRRTLVVSTAAFLVVAPVVVLTLVLGVGAILVTQDVIAPATLIPFTLLAPTLAAPVGAVGTRLQQIQSGRAAAARITDLLDEPPLSQPESPRTPVGRHVRLRGVRVSYDGEHDVLHDIDLDLAPGTVTALVGPSGSGKSTLAALLPRFHDANAGTVDIGGVDVRDIAAGDLYRTVGFVFQDVRLLADSVADNIRLGRPEATHEQVIRAATAARIHERVLELPRGYDSVVGQDAQFSGGEAQRVSIARALLTDAPILVLDEATAFADPTAEAHIQDALSELATGRTVLVIAHRLETVREADNIVVLDTGRVVEQGRHDQLLAADGPYARLWHRRARVRATADPENV
ncbi:ABC transporter ATP-binding protein [Streptomyces sp. SID3343]|uniref:ABC transporter ATP-binding protein n=1 Tax=Streptomyces sp. SID3343 TaxID=2690260 RepID=UPI001369B0F4|nr:ABC transporter ATP-binding protein [Streptomyces sp. SID3343]MYW01244.1 ATP-binding cassette domain-containing protein [Streptomyces sp. SID3343]